MNRRTFLECGAAALALPKLLRRDDRSSFLLSRRGCGRATGYAETNKIVSRDGRRHVAWLDSEGEEFLVRVRSLDEASGSWSPTITVGEAQDNHGGPALTQDAEGFLHLVHGPHHGPFLYRRSLRPNDASAWGEQEAFGRTCTYPTLVCAQDGTLICTGRVSHGDRAWEMQRWQRAPGGEWSAPKVLMRADHGGYAHFQEALSWGPDQESLHLSVRFYSKRRGHTVAHARSRDRGLTWRGSDGGELPSPFTARDVLPIRQDRESEGVGLRCGSLAVDANDAPHVLVSSYDSLPMQTWLYSLRPGEAGPSWHARDLRELLPATYRDWGLTQPGGLVLTPAGELVIVLTLIRPDSTVDKVLWGHPTSEPVLLRAASVTGELSFELLTEPDPARPRWLPSLERPTGTSQVPRPGLLYTDGGKGGGNSDILANDVRWLALG